MFNPGRRRRRRRYHRNPHRRTHHRYRRSHFRKNPGGMLIDLAKQAIPVLVGFYGARMFVAKAPSLPLLSSVAGMLGSFATPAFAVGSVLLANWGTKKVALLAKHRTGLMLGVGFQALDTVIRAFAPASVQSLIGMNDYIAVGGMGDYYAMGAGPIDDSMTMSDYIAVGVDEELGLDEELGVDEDLGDAGIGMQSFAGGNGLMKQIPQRAMVAPVPTRSFTMQVPDAGSGYDNPGQLYAGIFANP